MPWIHSARLRADHFKESKGEGESLQEIVAKKHQKKRWEGESSPTLHKGHTRWAGGMWKTKFNLLLEGTMSQAIFQRKSFSLSFRLSFQRSFHLATGSGEWIGIDLWLLIILWANLVENNPFAKGVQMNLLSDWEEKFIFRTSLIVTSSKR